MSYPLLKRLFNTAALRLQSCCRACIQRQEFKLNRSVDVFVSNFFPRILMRYVSRGLEALRLLRLLVRVNKISNATR
jgi:hypothetical protein